MLMIDVHHFSVTLPTQLHKHHGLRGSGCTVVTMTSKVNGKMEILTPCRSETAEDIETKIGPLPSCQFSQKSVKGVCSPYSWNITLNCVIPSLSFPFFLSSPTAKTGGQIFTIYASNDAASPKDVPFGGINQKKNYSAYQNPIKPPKVGVVRRFQAKCKKNWIFNILKTIRQINTKYDRRLKTAKAPSWPHTMAPWRSEVKFNFFLRLAWNRPTTPISWLNQSKMAAGRHFGKRKIAITQPLFQTSSPNLVRWWPWTARNVVDVMLL